jgi:hypothetical protein
MRQTCLFAAAVAALILACVPGWLSSQARVATPSVQIDPIQFMESAKQLPVEHFFIIPSCFERDLAFL